MHSYQAPSQGMSENGGGVAWQGGSGESAAKAAAEAALVTVVPVISNAADAAAQGFDKAFPGLYAMKISSGSITGPRREVRRSGDHCQASGSGTRDRS